MLKSTNLYIRLHGFLKTAFIDFSKGTVCNSRLLFLSLFPHTSVHTSRERNTREHVEEKKLKLRHFMANQLKDFIWVFFFFSLIFQFNTIFCFTQTKPCIQPCFSQDNRP